MCVANDLGCGRWRPPLPSHRQSHPHPHADLPLPSPIPAPTAVEQQGRRACGVTASGDSRSRGGAEAQPDGVLCRSIDSGPSHARVRWEAPTIPSSSDALQAGADEGSGATRWCVLPSLRRRPSLVAGAPQRRQRHPQPPARPRSVVAPSGKVRTGDAGGWAEIQVKPDKPRRADPELDGAQQRGPPRASRLRSRGAGGGDFLAPR